MKPAQNRRSDYLTGVELFTNWLADVYLCRTGGRVGWRRPPAGGQTEDDSPRPPASYRPPSRGSPQSCGRSLAGLLLQNKTVLCMGFLNLALSSSIEEGYKDGIQRMDFIIFFVVVSTLRQLLNAVT
jgi:hypothetical protein